MNDLSKTLKSDDWTPDEEDLAELLERIGRSQDQPTISHEAARINFSNFRQLLRENKEFDQAHSKEIITGNSAKVSEDKLNKLRAALDEAEASGDPIPLDIEKIKRNARARQREQ